MQLGYGTAQVYAYLSLSFTMASLAFVMSDMLPMRSADLGSLRELLSKHQVPRGVKARFIHKHFNVVNYQLRR